MAHNVDEYCKEVEEGELSEEAEETLSEQPTTRENILDPENLTEEHEDAQNEDQLRITSKETVSDTGSSSSSDTKDQKEPETPTHHDDKTAVNTVTPRRSSRKSNPPPVYDNSWDRLTDRIMRKRRVSEPEDQDKENTPGPAGPRKKMKVDNSRKGSKINIKSKKVKPADLEEMIADLGGPKRSGNCVRAGIARGFIKIIGNQLCDLEVVVTRGKLDCGHEVEATVRHLLLQPDNGGWDEELENTVIRCDRGCPDGRTYVTGMCHGNPQFTYGEDHNHCNVCGDHGQCIGDYREAHCRKCNNHYHRGGALNFPCTHCGKKASLRKGSMGIGNQGRGLGNQYVWQ